MSLHPVRGHAAALQALGRARARGTFPTALLLHGPPGVGKQRVALWAAQLLLCEAAGETPCGACRSCRMALRLEHPDLHWYFPVARPKGSFGSNERLAEALEDARAAELAETRVRPLRPSWSDEARAIYLAAAQALRRKARSRPAMSPVQVFILARAETLVPQESSPEAANALLKLLEEPPEDTFFILTSGEPGRLLPTIRSRTVPLHLAPLPHAEVRDFLVEAAGAEPGDAEDAAALGQGSIGRALGFLPDENGEDGRGPLDAVRRRTVRLLAAALHPDPSAGLARALEYPPAGARALLDDFAFLETWLRDLGGVTSGAGDRLVNQDAREYLEALARDARVHPAAAAAAQAAVEEAREQARGNVNPQLVVAGLLARLRRELRETAPSAG